MSAVIQDNPECGTTRVPLAAGAGTRTLLFDPAGGPVSLARFLAQVRALAARLPEGSHAINLCEDRHRFMLAFCAAALRGQATLLPPSRAPGEIAREAARHADSYCLGDLDYDQPPPRYWRLPAQLDDGDSDGDTARIDPGALAAIGFTSGSTGEPGAHPKSWASFRASTAQNQRALRDLWAADACAHVVATVPPQHMYGMEMTVLLPLLGEVAVHAGRPFFPHDILQALREVPAPRVLVTTPVHLRALVDACATEPELPALVAIVSATAPMPSELAAAAELRFGCELREFFGSTETCVIAQRRSARDEAWRPFPDVRLQPQPDGCLVHAPQLATPVVLADLVDVAHDGTFVLRGRNADLLEIAGKRASLGDLTRKLQSIPGVVDGVVFQADANGTGGVRRIAALAVAPGLDEAAILEVLRGSIDPVFLPRPLRCVASLPRNATGKLPQCALRALLATQAIDTPAV